MRAVVQRVHRAYVEVDGQRVGTIAKGIVAFVGAEHGDDDTHVAFIANKLCSLRIFQDESGKMRQSVTDIDGEALIVSQFTLLGDVRRGNRPSFTDALAPDEARRLIDGLVERMVPQLRSVQTGRFGADMKVLVENDGPVTILIDSRKRF